MSLKSRVSSASKSSRSEMYNARKSGGTKSRPLKQHNRVSSGSDSETESDIEMTSRKNGKCLSRNAIIARMNRIKKKNYINSLEQDLARYKSESENMRSNLTMQTKMVQTLRNEVQYLKNVLANSKEISLIMKTVRDSTGLPVISSLKPMVKCEPVTDLVSQDLDLSSAALPVEDEDCMLPSYDESFDESKLLGDLDLPQDFDELLSSTEFSCNVGVCLHVAQQRVSLEFCSLCNSKAAAAWESMAT